MTKLEMVLFGIIFWQLGLYVVMQYRWAKKENELLDRIMAKHYQEYVLAEDLRKPKKPAPEIVVDPDVIPVT